MNRTLVKLVMVIVPCAFVFAWWAVASGEFWHEYTHLLRDPAHFLYELTLMLVIDGLLIGLLVPRWIKRHDEEHHAEHRPPLMYTPEQVEEAMRILNSVTLPERGTATPVAGWWESASKVD